MKSISEGNQGVSPVVGVILMVAITVILSAIVASFVLDMGSGDQPDPTASVSFVQNQDTDGSGYMVTVQLTSVPSVDYITITGPGTTDKNGDNTYDKIQIQDDEVGSSETIYNLESGDKLTVTATLDGNVRVIQTFTVG